MTNARPLRMPAIIIADDRSPSHLVEAARAVADMTPSSAWEAAFVDACLAVAMLSLEYGPEADRDIWYAANAPGAAGYAGPAADAWAALVAQHGASLTDEMTCAFIVEHFSNHAEQLVAACDEQTLKRDFADLGVSTGYIGNCESWGDNRSFRVFTKVKPALHGDRSGVFGKPGTSRSCADTLSMHIMDVPREYQRFERGQKREYFNGPVPFNAPHVRAWLEALRAEIAAGRAFVLQPTFA